MLVYIVTYRQNRTRNCNNIARNDNNIARNSKNMAGNSKNTVRNCDNRIRNGQNSGWNYLNIVRSGQNSNPFKVCCEWHLTFIDLWPLITDLWSSLVHTLHVCQLLPSCLQKLIWKVWKFKVLLVSWPHLTWIWPLNPHVWPLTSNYWPVVTVLVTFCEFVNYLVPGFNPALARLANAEYPGLNLVPNTLCRWPLTSNSDLLTCYWPLVKPLVTLYTCDNYILPVFQNMCKAWKCDVSCQSRVCEWPLTLTRDL